MFDTLIPLQYNEQDRRAGYFFGKDRRGQLHRVPLMTLSIGIVTNRHRRFAHPAQVSELATEMKSYAKTLPGLGIRGGPAAGHRRRGAPGVRPPGTSREDARDERHLSELRDRLPGGPGQGPRGRGAGALRRVQRGLRGAAASRRATPVSAAAPAAPRPVPRRAGAPPPAPAAPTPQPPPPAPRAGSAAAARRPPPPSAAPGAPAAPARATSGAGRPASRHAAARAAGVPQPPAAAPSRGRPSPASGSRGAVGRPAPPRRPRRRSRLRRRRLPPRRRPRTAAAARRRPGARPVNPFLSQDPSLKARRLARALVSDIVVYHPAKRQEGLRDGTLKELFEEEIKKSWEEYTEQVGPDVAESTAVLPRSAERDPGRRAADLLSARVSGERARLPRAAVARSLLPPTAYLPASSCRRHYACADLTDRLTELQHRVTELRDFL